MPPALAASATGSAVPCHRRHGVASLTHEKDRCRTEDRVTDERAELERHLRSLVEEYGRRLLRDPRQLAASVSDVAPGRRTEGRALEAAAEAGVADALLDASGGGRLTDDSRAPVAQRLAVAAGLPPELAGWAVDAFASALQLSPGASGAIQLIAPGGCVVTDPGPTTPAPGQTPTPPDWAGAGAGRAGARTRPDAAEQTQPEATAQGRRRLLAVIMIVVACALMSSVVVLILAAVFTETVFVGGPELLILTVAAGLGFGLLNVAFGIGRFRKWWR